MCLHRSPYSPVVPASPNPCCYSFCVSLSSLFLPDQQQLRSICLWNGSKSARRGDRQGGGTKGVMSWLTRYCCLLTCVISALPSKKITSLWLETQKAFQGTICYLALRTCINKQTNQGMLALPQAPWPCLMVMVMGDNSSGTTKDGKIFKAEKGWL